MYNRIACTAILAIVFSIFNPIQAQKWTGQQQFEIAYSQPDDWWLDGFGNYDREGWDEHGSSVCHCTGSINGVDGKHEVKMAIYPSTEEGLKNSERMMVWDYEWVPVKQQTTIKTAFLTFQVGVSKWKDNQDNHKVLRLQAKVQEDFYLIVYLFGEAQALQKHKADLETIVGSFRHKKIKGKATPISLPIDGKKVVEEEPAPKELSSADLMPESDGKKWGYVDINDEEFDNFIIEPVYKQAWDFDAKIEGQAVVSMGSKKNGTINSKGEVVIPLIYDEDCFDILLSDKGEYLRARKKGKQGAISLTGEELVPFEFHQVEEFGENLRFIKAAYKNESVKLFDSGNNHKLVNETAWEEYMYVEGLDNTPYVYAKQNGKYGFVNLETGKVILDYKYDSDDAVYLEVKKLHPSIFE